MQLRPLAPALLFLLLSGVAVAVAPGVASQGLIPVAAGDVSPVLGASLEGGVAARAFGLRTDRADLLLQRARIQDALCAHDFRAAVAACEALLRERPQDVTALLALSDAQLELGELASAEAALQRVLDLKPAAPAYLRAGYLLHLRGDDDAAVAAYELALDAIPPAERRVRAWALAEQGHLLRQQGELEQADQRYVEALELDSRCGQALRGRGLVAWGQGALGEAERFLRLAPPTPAGLGELARLQRALGRRDAAARTLRQGLELGESDPHWRRSLARLLADEELEPERAVRLAQAELAIRPGVHTWDACAWSLHAAGREAEALTAIERALAVGVREPELLDHAGRIALALDDPRGEAWLAEAHARDPRLAR